MIIIILIIIRWSLRSTNNGTDYTAVLNLCDWKDCCDCFSCNLLSWRWRVCALDSVTLLRLLSRIDTVSGTERLEVVCVALQKNETSNDNSTISKSMLRKFAVFSTTAKRPALQLNRVKWDVLNVINVLPYLFAFHTYTLCLRLFARLWMPLFLFAFTLID